MPWCPDCRTEYDPGNAVCADCGADLVDEMPAGNEPAVVYEADSLAEAQVVEATLESEGIPAYVSPASTLLAGESLVDEDSHDLDVLVPGSLAGAARDVLNEPQISEDELSELADPQP